MHTAQQTNLSNTPFHRKTCLCLNGRLIIAICPLIFRTPAKPTETTEVLTDIGHMQVLVFHVGNDISCTILPHLICSSCYSVDSAVVTFQEILSFCHSKAMSAEYI